MSAIKPGDEVLVFNGWQHRDPGTRCEVVKVGRALAYIRWNGRDEAFRLETGRIEGAWPSCAHFMTLEDAKRRDRRIAAVNLLRAAGVEFTLGRERKFTLEQIEALAEVVRKFGTGEK